MKEKIFWQDIVNGDNIVNEVVSLGGISESF